MQYLSCLNFFGMMTRMKWLRLALLSPFVFFLAGCFDVDEVIDIRPGGGGRFEIHSDLSQLIETMQTFMGTDETAKSLASKKTDTVFYMKSMVDTAKDVSPENKALVRDGTLHVKIDPEQKIIKSDVLIPFTSQDNLQKLYNAMNDGSLGVGNMFRAMGNTTAKDSAAAPMDVAAPEGAMPGGSMPDMNQFNSVYTFQSRDGFLSRKLDQAKWKDIQQNAQFGQLKDAQQMGISIPYTLTVHLPRSVKKVDNALATVSADKKTVTLKYNLIEVLQHPEKFEYSIAY